MNAFRRLAPYAALPLLLLLPGCGGGAMEDQSRQEIDVRQHLPQVAGGWTQEPPRSIDVRLGPDSLPVTVGWTPVRNGQHRGISRVTVDFPPHRASDELNAGVSGTPANMGTRSSLLQALVLHVQWARSTAGQKQSHSATVVLKGDGTSTVDASGGT